MDADFDSVFTLRLRLRAAQNEISSLRSGQAYVRMTQEYQQQLRTQDREIIRLRKEVGNANATVVTMREHWTEVLDDISKTASRSLRRKEPEIEKLQKRIRKVEKQRDEALDKLQSEREAKYQALTELEEEKGKNRKLQPPEEITNDPDYYKTGKIITKKLVEIQLQVIVKEYQAEEYRRHSNGSRYHAPFPDGVCNEINYGSSEKAFAFCLNNYCNVPIQKVSEFLCDLTDERVRLSAGFINGLSKEFSAKTKEERTELFEGTLIHDHDLTFYHYATAHQECLAHVLRYLKDSMQNEPKLEWNKRMHDFLRKVIHEHKQADRRLSEERIRKIEKEYDEILEQAKQEYAYEPPSDYYNIVMRSASLNQGKVQDRPLTGLSKPDSDDGQKTVAAACERQRCREAEREWRRCRARRVVHRLVGAHRIPRAFTRRTTRRETPTHSLCDEDRSPEHARFAVFFSWTRLATV